MADSVTIKTRLQYAIAGDYSTLPLAIDYGNGQDLVSATPSQSLQKRQAMATGGSTFSLANFTTVTTAYLHNEDLTNYVTVTWTSAGAANSQKVPAQGFWLVPQADIANVVVTANTANCICTLILFGT